MNCPKCQNEIKENQKFCRICGTALEGISTAENEAAEIPDIPECPSSAAKADIPKAPTSDISEAAVASENVPKEADATTLNTDNETGGNTDVALESEKKPKKRFNIKKFLAISLPVIALLLIIALNLNLIIGYAVKLFGTPAQYMAYVENKALAAQIKSYRAMYENFLENQSFNGSSTAELKLSVSDRGFDMLSSIVSLNSDTDISQFEFLKEIGLTMDTDLNGELARSQVTVSLKDNKVLTTDCYIDEAKGYLYLGLPELSDEYLKLPYSPDMLSATPYISADYAIAANSASSMGANLLSMSSDYITAYTEENATISADTLVMLLNDIMPTEQELEQSLTQYIKTALGCIDDAKMDKTDLTIDGITNNVTQITVEVDTELMMRMAIAVLNDIKNDKNVENVINRAEKSISENVAPVEEDSYGLFADALDEAIKSMEETLNSSEFENEPICTLHTYINFRHEVVGHAIVTDDAYGKKQKYVTATVYEGNEYRYLAETPLGLTVNGKGTLSGGTMSGEFISSYSVNDEEFDIVKITVSDYNINETRNGNLKCSMTITPMEDLLKQLEFDDELTAFISLSDLSVKLDFDIDRSKSYTAIGISAGDNPLVTLSMESKKKDAEKIDLPAKTVTVDDEDDFAAWFSTLDFGELADALEDADVPKEITQTVRMLALMALYQA